MRDAVLQLLADMEAAREISTDHATRAHLTLFSLRLRAILGLPEED